MKKITALLLALLMALSLSLVGCGDSKKDKDDGDSKTPNTAEAVAKAYCEAYYNGNLEKADSYALLTKEIELKRDAKVNDMDFEEYLKDFYGVESMKEYWKQEEEGYKEYLSGKVKVDEVKDAEERTSKKVKDWKDDHEYYFDNYDLDIDKVEAVCDVTLKLKNSGDNNGKKTIYQVTMVEYDSNWKVWDVIYVGEDNDSAETANISYSAHD